MSGDEDACRLHLPIAQSKASAFADRCERAGLKQDTFSFLFAGTGVVMEAQYVFGQLSLQLYAPIIIPVEEEGEEETEQSVAPKTFWVNTSIGYFWVEVRYADDNSPIVILTQFVALDGDAFVYPGMELTAPGMLAGCFGDTAAGRYVISQNGGVMNGDGEDRATILSTAIIDNNSRLTVVDNVGDAHDFLLMHNTLGRNVEVRRVKVSAIENEFSVDRGYTSIFMDGETLAISPATMLNAPTWIHRKCLGSYYSPNKTIGYHVDIGLGEGEADDYLDNNGGFGESLFNHTPDIYRLGGLISFPVSITGDTVRLLLVSPTMLFTIAGTGDQRCWGGYGLTQSWASCVDYQQDFDVWYLSPRLIYVDVDLSTGVKSFIDPALGGSCDVSFDAMSWDGKFSATFFYDVSHACDTDFYSEMVTKPAGTQCSWTEECTWRCDTNDPGSDGECPKGWTPYSHWEHFSREDLRLSKRACFLLGNDGPDYEHPNRMDGHYLLFDGLWHLDIGVLWVTARIEGNYCGLCMYPYASQEPGENVYFALQGASAGWALASGHEYVENMNIVTPLGYMDWPSGGTVLGFVAQVPEEYAAPHAPVLMKGGIMFKSEDVESEMVYCERALMSAPCECASNEMFFDAESTFQLGGDGYVYLENGCAPFEVVLTNANVGGKTYLLTDGRSFSIDDIDECSASITVKDVCGTQLSIVEEYEAVDTPVVSGPTTLDPGDTGYYIHNMGAGAVYTGTLEMVGGATSTAATLRMPVDAASGSLWTVSWEGKCETVAEMTVSASEFCDDSLPTEGYGEPFGLRIYSGFGCGTITSTECGDDEIPTGGTGDGYWSLAAYAAGCSLVSCRYWPTNSIRRRRYIVVLD